MGVTPFRIIDSVVFACVSYSVWLHWLWSPVGWGVSPAGLYVAVSLGSAAAAGEFWPAPPCGQPSPQPADPLEAAPTAGTCSVKTRESQNDLQVEYYSEWNES